MAVTTRYGGVTSIFRNLKKKLVHIPGHHCDCVNGSDEETEKQTRLTGSQGKTEIDYRSLGQNAWEVMWDLINSDDSQWRKESGSNTIDGIVHSRLLPKYGKVFRLQGLVEMSAADLFYHVVTNQIDQPRWNPSVIECRTIEPIDENTDISYNVAAEAGGGLITSRDFVTIRHWGEKDGIHMSAGMATTHPDMPPQKKHVRGENGPGGWAMKTIPGEPNQCIFIWLVNTNLKGWLPQKLIDQSISTVCLDMLGHIRKLVDKKNAEK